MLLDKTVCLWYINGISKLKSIFTLSSRPCISETRTFSKNPKLVLTVIFSAYPEGKKWFKTYRANTFSCSLLMSTLLESLSGHDLSKSDKNYALVTKNINIEVDSLKKKDTQLYTLCTMCHWSRARTCIYVWPIRGCGKMQTTPKLSQQFGLCVALTLLRMTHVWHLRLHTPFVTHHAHDFQHHSPTVVIQKMCLSAGFFIPWRASVAAVRAYSWTWKMLFIIY